MKKSVYESILSLISTIDSPEAEEVRAEVSAELAKGKAKADANREAYEQAKDIVLDALSETTPATVSEIYAEVKSALPANFSESKVRYALGNYWEAEVVAHDGKVKSYTRKVA